MEHSHRALGLQRNGRVGGRSLLEWLSSYRNADVQGWVQPRFFDFIPLLDDALEAADVRGGIMEIGVHHGRLFIALNALADAECQSVAIDVFEDQHLNIDKSGSGSLGIFRSNLGAYDVHRGMNTTIIKEDSTFLREGRFYSDKGFEPFKIISIDGGHTAEHTINDLQLASSLLHPFGLVLLDDILHPEWLGVIDGATMYLRQRPILWPLAVAFNKLVFCRMSAYPMFRRFFDESKRFSRPTRLCGYEVLPAI